MDATHDVHQSIPCRGRFDERHVRSPPALPPLPYMLQPDFFIRYTANMFFVLLMSQHAGDTSFNLVRFTIAVGCQRFVLFLMSLRCRIALPKYSFMLGVDCTMKLFASILYFAFAAFVVYAPLSNDSHTPVPVNNTLLLAAKSEEAVPIIHKLQYLSMVAVLECLSQPASIFIPYLAQQRMPLHLPHVLERYGCFLLVVMGEIALGISQYLPTASGESEVAVYAQSFIVLWALLLFKLLYFDLAEVHIDDHAMRISKYTGYSFNVIHVVLFGATALLGSCVDILVLSAMSHSSAAEDCMEDESTFDASSTSLMCGSLMLFVVLILQCLHRGVHTHRTVAEDLVHLECELISLEQEKQHQDCAVDIQTFKGLLRSLDDPADVKRIFGKEMVIPPGLTPSVAQKAEAQEKQLIQVFNMFATQGSSTLGSKELQSLHLFLSDAAVVDKKVRGLLSHAPSCPPPLLSCSRLPSSPRSALSTPRNPASAKCCGCCCPCFSWSWRSSACSASALVCARLPWRPHSICHGCMLCPMPAFQVPQASCTSSATSALLSELVSSAPSEHSPCSPPPSSLLSPSTGCVCPCARCRRSAFVYFCTF